MATAVGDLVVNLGANIKPLKAGMDRARAINAKAVKSMFEMGTAANRSAVANRKQLNSMFGVGKAAEVAKKPVDQMTNTLNKQTNTLNKQSKSSTAGVRGMLELSRGAEDAAVSFGVNGFQGALRGSINNLTQFAFITGGPALGAVAGFAAAGVAMAAAFFKMSEGSKDAANGIEELNVALERQNKLTMANLQFARQRRDAPNTLPAARGSLQSKRDELENAQQRNKKVGAEHKDVIRGFGKTIAGDVDRSFLNSILQSQGKSGRAVGARARVRGDLSAGNVKPEFIEKALKVQGNLNGMVDDFNKLTDKTRKGVSSVAIEVRNLERQVGLLENDFKKVKENQPNLDFLIDFDRRKQAAEQAAGIKARKGVTPGPGPNLDFLIDADRIKQRRDAEQKLLTANKKSAERFKQLFKSPLDKIADQFKEARRLNKAGFLSQGEFGAIRSKLGERAAALGPKAAPQPRLSFAEAAEAGSREAFSIINASRGRKPEEKTEKNTEKTAKNTEGLNTTMNELLALLKTGDVQVVGL